jgi:peptidylprolyl isomerase
MSQLVCPSEKAAFFESVEFLRYAPDSENIELAEFEARTQRSDGTSATIAVSARFVMGELSEWKITDRVKLVRDGGEWCISGEQDRFRSVRESAKGLFVLLNGEGVSEDARSGFSEDVRSIPAEVVTPRPGDPPEIEGEVVTTDSGLRYVEVEVGAGPNPEPGQTVLVHYTLWLEAGGVRIDSSFERGEPFEFVLGGGEVVAGFDEGLATMREGGKRRLIVSPKLGYGDDDDYEDIPPNSTLIFDVDLVEVQ